MVKFSFWNTFYYLCNFFHASINISLNLIREEFLRKLLAERIHFQLQHYEKSKPSFSLLNPNSFHTDPTTYSGAQWHRSHFPVTGFESRQVRSWNGLHVF